MVSVLVYSQRKRSIIELEAAAKEIIARISEDYWQIKQINVFEKLGEYLSENPLIHLIIYEICDKNSLEFLVKIRKSYQQAGIMLLTDTSVSPMEYIRPDLKISSLLLCPWTREQVYRVLYDFFCEYLEDAEREKSNGRNSYVIETKEGTINIPYSQIYFFEARDKKVYVCTGKEEYGFYSTIDKLTEDLPDNFIRCHRGFIVNGKKIRKILLSQNIIFLNDGFNVPLSRSYKAVLKGMGK